MAKTAIKWFLIVLVTAVNLICFLNRWVEKPLSGLPEILSRDLLDSIVSGTVLGAIAVGAMGNILRQRWLSALCTIALAGLALTGAKLAPAFSKMLHPVLSAASLGFFCALVCLSVADERISGKQKRPAELFSFFLFASLNAFLFIGPFTSFIPGFVQDSVSPAPSFSAFYYGSVHMDISIVSVCTRRLVNFFFDLPSINATILSSMLYVSVAIACVGWSISMVFGAVWGWVIILAAITDRWLVASAISSSAVSMPIFSAGMVLALCTWAIYRERGILSLKEVFWLSLFNVVNLLFSLYSYSSSRIPWLVGSIAAALILMIRGAIPLSSRGLSRAFATLIPSITVVAILIVAVFGGDVGRFKAQLTISPKQEQLIENINSYPVKVTPFHDVDMPVWWGSGRPEGLNLTVYWPRSLGEIMAELSAFFRALAQGCFISPYLSLLAATGLIMCLCSANILRRWFGGVLVCAIFGGFLPYLLAQDLSAYRRGLATALPLEVALVSLFAVLARPGRWRMLSVCAPIALFIGRIPLEINPLFSNELHVPLCIACHEHFNVREFVNNPLFKAVALRKINLITDSIGMNPVESRCISWAINSHEMQGLSPGLVAITSNSGLPSETYAKLSEGEVLVVTCPLRPSEQPEISSICSDRPPFGKLLGSFNDPSKGITSRPRWVFIEKL